ncbi:MAG: hypothetical protein WDO73_15975 [Ignavibacteriota bacterium]
MLNLSLRLKGLVVTALPVVALLASVHSFFVVSSNIATLENGINSALQVFADMQKVRTALLEESGAVRSYALTDDPQHLKTYHDSLNDGDAAVRHLESTADFSPKSGRTLPPSAN